MRYKNIVKERCKRILVLQRWCCNSVGEIIAKEGNELDEIMGCFLPSVVVPMGEIFVGLKNLISLCRTFGYNTRAWKKTRTKGT
jgi:hypothetical protein